MRSNITPTHARSNHIPALILLLFIAAAIRVWMFNGLAAMDGSIYSARGLEVANGIWLQSDYIGELRFGVNLPIAAAVGFLGRTEGALAAWGLICSLVEIALVYVFATRAWGTRVAILRLPGARDHPPTHRVSD